MSDSTTTKLIIIKQPHTHQTQTHVDDYSLITTQDSNKIISNTSGRGGIKIFKALARLASNSKFLLAKSEKNSPKSCLC
jgi:hypothetical protein